MTTEAAIDKKRSTDYETIFILRADIDADASEKAITRTVSALEQSGGILVKVESWGKRRLAFPIGKQKKGFYVYVRYLGYRGTVAEIERNLRMLDSVLRYMTVAVGRDVDPASIAIDPEDVKVRRIEIAEGEEDREESLEAALGMGDDYVPYGRQERQAPSDMDHAEADAPEGEAPAPNAAADEPKDA